MFFLPTINTERKPGHVTEKELPNVTLVMAYFNLGDVVKSIGKHTRTKAYYLGWVEFYQWMENPMVIYSDDDEFLDKVRVLRQNFSDRTLIFNVSEQEPLW